MDQEYITAVIERISISLFILYLMEILYVEDKNYLQV